MVLKIRKSRPSKGRTNLHGPIGRGRKPKRRTLGKRVPTATASLQATQKHRKGLNPSPTPIWFGEPYHFEDLWSNYHD